MTTEESITFYRDSWIPMHEKRIEAELKLKGLKHRLAARESYKEISWTKDAIRRLRERNERL